jgi:hypothetical protein
MDDVALTQELLFIAACNERQRQSIFRSCGQRKRRHAKYAARCFVAMRYVRRKRVYVMAEFAQHMRERFNGRHDPIDDRTVYFREKRYLQMERPCG